jgi:hypothetical protein
MFSLSSCNKTADGSKIICTLECERSDVTKVTFASSEEERIKSIVKKFVKSEIYLSAGLALFGLAVPLIITAGILLSATPIAPVALIISAVCLPVLAGTVYCFTQRNKLVNESTDETVKLFKSHTPTQLTDWSRILFHLKAKDIDGLRSYFESTKEKDWPNYFYSRSSDVEYMEVTEQRRDKFIYFIQSSIPGTTKKAAKKLIDELVPFPLGPKPLALELAEGCSGSLRAAMNAAATLNV